MYKYLLTLEYIGTHYSGWQKQSQNSNTIQEICQKVIEDTLQQKVTLGGASRTDKGVHAKDQKVLFKTHVSNLGEQFLKELNKELKEDIHFTKISIIKENEHPLNNIMAKEYYYRFTLKNEEIENIYSLPYFLEVNRKKVDFFLSHFKGKHNFQGFSVLGSRKIKPIREIQEISLDTHNNVYIIKIKADGFLKYMIRFIIGSLILYLKNEIKIDEVVKSLETGCPLPKSYKAPAKGLTLEKIFFKT